jgi:uncharacterized protein involved in exopolysaccharide biosynthesis
MTLQQLRDLYAFVVQAMLRRWRLAAAVFAAAAFLALVGTVFMPRSYYSEARLYVKFGRDHQIDPIATGGQMVSVYETRENEINSLIENFKSRAILDRVVEELGPKFILSGRAKPAEEKVAASSSATTSPQPPSSAHQQAVMQLEREVSVWSPRKTNTINVSCKAKSPAIAQQIVAKLVEVYLSEHVRVHHTPGSYEFFVEQTAVSKKAWQSTAAKLRETKNRLSIVTIEGKRKELETQIGDIASKLLTNEAELKAAEAKITSLKKLLTDLPATILTQKVEGPNAAFDGMRQTLYQAEAKEQELASKMNDNHPQLVAVRQQVIDLRAILADQPIQRQLATQAANPTRQAIDLALANEQSTADSPADASCSYCATSFAATATAQRTKRRSPAPSRRSGPKPPQGIRLEARAGRINRSLMNASAASASFSPRATSPNRPARVGCSAGLGLMFAVVSSIGAALVAAYLNPVFISMNDLGQLLDLPLVGTLPREVFRPAASV